MHVRQGAGAGGSSRYVADNDKEDEEEDENQDEDEDEDEDERRVSEGYTVGNQEEADEEEEEQEEKEEEDMEEEEEEGEEEEEEGEDTMLDREAADGEEEAEEEEEEEEVDTMSDREEAEEEEVEEEEGVPGPAALAKADASHALTSPGKRPPRPVHSRKPVSRNRGVSTGGGAHNGEVVSGRGGVSGGRGKRRLLQSSGGRRKRRLLQEFPDVDFGLSVSGSGSGAVDADNAAGVPGYLEAYAGVEVSGLKARPDLNGAHGRVIVYMPDRERYQVRIMGRGLHSSLLSST